MQSRQTNHSLPSASSRSMPPVAPDPLPVANDQKSPMPPAMRTFRPQTSQGWVVMAEPKAAAGLNPALGHAKGFVPPQTVAAKSRPNETASVWTAFVAVVGSDQWRRTT